jgi:hypothetical protein
MMVSGIQKYSGNLSISCSSLKELTVDSLYTVHRYFNEACSAAGIHTELLVSEDDLRVALVNQPLGPVATRLRNIATAKGIIPETRVVSSGVMEIMN